MSGQRVPSIRTRLANALLLWAVLWGLGVAVAVGFAAQREVDELLDESLQATAALLASALTVAYGDTGPRTDAAPLPSGDEGEFAWQLVAAGGAVMQRSANAPAVALHAAATAGFSATSEWRVFGAAMGHEGRMLYVAHTMGERVESRAEAALSAALAALSIGLLAHWWLRARVRHELRPLERLTDRLVKHDPLGKSQALGAAERAELAPVHAAIDDLGQRLARRVAHERAFSAHAAHALRTPLAGMEAQLAVAMRESTPAVQQRLQRVREASGRLQRVVQALLDLFRVGAEVQRGPVDLKALLAHLPVEGLAVHLQGDAALSADPDLLAAALSNLLDNAKRYGAGRVEVSVPLPGVLRVADDGRGVTPERLRLLRNAIHAQDYDGHTGLGLMLADLIARSHGGSLRLPDTADGFVVELVLGPFASGPR
ncbi:MAG: HAMP domain-containing sensor histidine kinase [Pseudomonadota bacterium]